MKKIFLISLPCLVIACTSIGGSDYEKPPALENRTLRISSNLAGFEYRYKECLKKGLFGKCKEEKWTVEEYDLTNVTVREKLINMGFVLKVKEKILP